MLWLMTVVQYRFSRKKDVGNYWISILLIAYTLNRLLYVLFVVLLYLLSVRQKVAKNSAHGKNLHKRPLFTPHTASPQSGACSSLQAIACFQGAAELDLCGYIRKVIPAQIFRQSSHNGLKTSGPPLDFSTVPFRRWRGICLAMGYSANFTRTMLISNRNRHHQNHS